MPLFILILTNLLGLLIFPIVISYRLESHPGIGSYLMLYAVTTFLKLVSFHHVYHDVRYLVKQVIAAKKKEKHDQKVLEPSMTEGTIFGVSKSVFDVAVTYPKCLTVGNFLRFMMAPTCCYQLTFPLIDHVRPKRLLKHFLEFMLAHFLMCYFFIQHVAP